MLYTPSALVEEDPTLERMDETSTIPEREFWKDQLVIPYPHMVIDREQADVVSFRGYLEEMSEDSRALRLEWLESARTYPSLTEFEKKLLHRAIELRREGEEFILRSLSRQFSLRVDSVSRSLERAISKFYVEERKIVINQVIV